MYGSIATFFGGLDKLIGEPMKHVERGIRKEHTEVPAGEYGASDVELTAGLYAVTFTPRREWQFVADPQFVEPMNAGFAVSLTVH